MLFFYIVALFSNNFCGYKPYTFLLLQIFKFQPTKPYSYRVAHYGIFAIYTVINLPLFAFYLKLWLFN